MGWDEQDDIGRDGWDGMGWDGIGQDGMGQKTSEPVTGNKVGNWSVKLLFKFCVQVCMHVHNPVVL